MGGQVLVSWTWPRLTTEGVVARRLGAFALWAVDVPEFGDRLAPQTIDEYRREVLRVESADLTGFEPGDRIELAMPLSGWQLEQEAVLAMTASNPAGRHAGYSNQVELDPRQPPLAAVWGDVAVVASGVALAWEPAARADEYALERASGSSLETFAKLGRLATTEFLDRTVRWGEAYSYRLRSLRESRAGWIEGGLSPAVQVTVLDTFAPQAPRDLRAIGTLGSVELSWAASPDGDVEGYTIYRDGVAIEPPVRGTTASADAVTDGPAKFWVTAFDAAGNESLPSNAVTVPPWAD